MQMEIELFYFDGCPHWQDALKNIKAALAAEGLKASLHLVKIADDDEAERLKFLGSPSFRVDGDDWWPDERKRYNISCRVYQTPLGIRGTPTVEMLREKLRTQNLKTR